MSSFIFCLVLIAAVVVAALWLRRELVRHIDRLVQAGCPMLPMGEKLKEIELKLAGLNGVAEEALSKADVAKSRSDALADANDRRRQVAEAKPVVRTMHGTARI